MNLNTSFEVIKETSNIATIKAPKEPEPLTETEMIQLETENKK